MAIRIYRIFNKKYFIYYNRVSVSDGLNTELCTRELTLDKCDKEMYQRFRYCCCVIEMKKAFKEDKDTCNLCVKLLQNRDEINCKIYIIWSNNQKYRVFTNLYRSFLDRIFINKNIKNKSGEIEQDTIADHLNSLT